MQQKQQESKTITAIAEYSATEAALAGLRARLKDAKYEVTTTAGIDLARKDRKELVTLRTDLEKKRVEIKAPALERCRLIDAEAKRITGELLLLEKPIDEQIKAEEARKEAIAAEKRRQEEARIAKIRERITKLQNLPLLIVGMGAEDLKLFIAKVEAQVIGSDFAELQQEAQTAKSETVGKLKTVLEDLIAKEEEDARIKAEQEAEAARLEALRIEQEKAAAAERERLAAEKAEQDRLNAIEQERLRKEREELEKLRAAELQRQEEADAKARLEREEADRIAAEERAKQQAIIDAERERLREEQEKLARIERERQEEEAAKQAEREAAASAANETSETVTIPKSEYDQLLKDSELLNALRAAGVDNWDGWDFAIDSLRGEA